MSTLVHLRAGGWIPKDHAVLQEWLANQLAQVRANQVDPRKFKPVIKKFLQAIEDDPVIYMLFTDMFDQVPTRPPYDKDSVGHKDSHRIKDYMEMLRLFDLILETPPGYDETKLVAFPINAILGWPMGTPAGLSAFVMDKVNALFKAMLDVWAEFLTSAESAGKLTDETDVGWFSTAAMKSMPNFKEDFEYIEGDTHRGYKTWDDFFTREFKAGRRDVSSADQSDSVITNACESTPVYLVSNVKKFAKFWIKEQPYSLHHMLNGDQSVSEFEGGTIYQAFLAAKDYHRWRSPVNGKVIKCVNIQGTYYAESPAFGFWNPDGPDPIGPDASEGFLTAVATRALIFIKANDPVGLMCFIGVGMSEVSSCEITVREGDTLKKGDELGMFHSGGSSCCLVFRKGVKLTFVPDVEAKTKILLNAKLATVG